MLFLDCSTQLPMPDLAGKHSKALTARRYPEPFFVRALNDSSELVTPEADLKAKLHQTNE